MEDELIFEFEMENSEVGCTYYLKINDVDLDIFMAEYYESICIEEILRLWDEIS
jgi:hypothetical protein